MRLWREVQGLGGIEAMKTTSRFILALLSSLLLSAGFVRAAERLDPISRATASQSMAVAPGEDCGTALSLVIDDVL